MATEALRELFARFVTEFDTKELEKGDSLVDDMVGKLKDFGKVVAGAFAVDAIIGFGRNLINSADQIGITANRLQVSTAALQEWQYAAKLSDIEAEELTASLQKLASGLAEAAAGKGQAEAFKKLGVGLKNADGTLKSSIQVFEEAGLAIGALENPTEAAGLAADLFGKQYARLLPLFKEGPEGIARLKQEFKDLGGGFSPEFIEQSQEFNDNLDRLAVGLKGLVKGLAVEVMPLILDFTRGAIDVVKSVGKWVKGTKILQAALVALSAKGIMALIRGVPLLIAKLGGLRAILMRLGLFALKVVAPFLILEDIIVFLSGGKSAIGRGLDAAFGPGTAKNIQTLVAEMMRFFGLFKSEPDKVRAAFAKLPQDLEEIFGGFGTFLGGWGQSIVDLGLFVTNALTGGWANFVAKAKAGGQGLMLALKIVWTEIKFAGLAVAASLSDAFDAAWAGILAGANKALNALADALALLPGDTDAADALRRTGSNLVEGAPKGGAGDTIAKLREQARFALADEGDRIGAAATAPAGGAAGSVTVTNNTDVSVTVPPGTPAEQAKGVAGAAKSGTEKGTLRATKAALVPTAG